MMNTERGRAPVVDIVIVNWNGRKYLADAISSIRRSTIPVAICVVDNASTDGSASYLCEAHPDVVVVALDSNAGYAGGANIGLRQGSAPYAFVMNPDVIIKPDHLQQLAERLDADPAIGAAQGKLYRIPPDEFRSGCEPRSSIIDSAGHLIKRSRMVVDRGEGESDSSRFSYEASVFSACGAALFLRRSMLEDLALDGRYFDPDFFAYKEDIDLCWRARLLGWDIRYIPSAVAYHVRGWTGKGAPPKSRLSLQVRRHSWVNHYLLIVKNDRLPALLRSAPSIIGWEFARQAYALLRDPLLYGAYLDLIRLIPSALRKRRELMARARAKPADLRYWFGASRARPALSMARADTREPANTLERS